MTRGTSIARLMAAAVAVAALAGGTANAGLLPTSVTIFPDAGNYRWQYAIVLPTDMKLQSGNYFTVYDFAGLVDGSVVTPDGNWTATVQNVGTTPVLLNPIDDPSIPNLVFTYTGPTIPAGQIGLGNFMATSIFGERKEVNFTAETNRTSDGLKDSNITSTDAPTGQVIENPIPEPATMLLAGLGLPLLGLARLRKKKKLA
jgi:PEP-CTERM motif